MQGIRIKEKVKVFISSNCGGRYTVVREALRLLLLETGMCEVYMFEEEGATTSDVERKAYFCFAMKKKRKQQNCKMK